MSVALLMVLSAGNVAGARPPVVPSVSKDTIKIGVHVPSTGADPLPGGSTAQGADVYWRWLELSGRTIHGRHVEVVVRNDNSNPAKAVQVCRELVEDKNVFLLFAPMQSPGVGSSQVQVCARYAASVNVPYVSPGHTKAALDELESYFATSEVWAAQTRALARVFAKNLGGVSSQHGLVYMNTPFGTDAGDAFEKAMEKQGAPVIVSRSIPKTAGAEHAQSVASELKLMGIDNVLVLAPATFMIQLNSAAENIDYQPQWVTAGFSGLLNDDTVGILCNSGDGYDGALATSPVPAFDDRNDYDADYADAMTAVYPEAQGGDMVSWMGWAAARQLHRMLDDVGRDLDRKAFINKVQKGSYKTEAMSSFAFSKKDHFGGRKSYLLEATCSTNEWSTLRRI